MSVDYRIAILSYNHPEITSRCVRSCLKLTDSKKIILVHNGSLTQHEDRLRNEFTDIQHASLTENRGFTGGTNFALKTVFAQAPFALFVTNDCELLSLPSFFMNSKASDTPIFAAPKIYRRKIEKIDSIGAICELKAGNLFHCKDPAQFSSAQSKYSRPYIPGTAFILHRDIFHTLGEFDETLHTYWEDVDYSMRASTKGIELKVDPTCTLLHSVGKTCHKDPFYTRYLFRRNQPIVIRRHLHWKHLAARLEFESRHFIKSLRFSKLK